MVEQRYKTIDSILPGHYRDVGVHLFVQW
jgi:hypothetical protein